MTKCLSFEMCILYVNKIISWRMNTYQGFDELMMDYMAGTLPADKERQLAELLKSDAVYRERFNVLSRMRAKSMVDKFEEEKAFHYGRLLQRLDLKTDGDIKRVSLWKMIIRVAAVVCLLVVCSSLIYYIYQDVRSTEASCLCQMEVPLGSQTKVTLPDGTMVRLNSGSVLKYDHQFLSHANREVYLEGEGYFEVQKNPDKPFVVHVEQLNVKVLGTIFNIRAYIEDPEIEVSLVEGKVNVFSTSETHGNIILLPDETLAYNKQSGKMNHYRNTNMQASLWTNGRLNFVHATIPEILKLVERQYNVRVVLQTDRMYGEVFSGSISKDLTIDEILDYLDVDNKYCWSRTGNVIVITDK